LKYKDLSNVDKRSIIEYYNFDSLTKTETVRDIADDYDISTRTVYEWIDKIQLENITEKPINNEQEISIVSEESKKIYKLEEENKSLKKALNEAKNHVIDSDDIKNIIYEINNIGYHNDSLIPEWIEKSSSSNEIVPVFCLSDIHIGSVIDASNVNYTNEYNIDIAKERIFQLVDDFIDMYKNKLSNYEYRGCVCIFGGDMIENAMHGTEEVNDLTVVNQVIETTSILIEVVKRLTNAFSNIFIPSVSGNHGRLIADKYVKNNNRLDHSLEKIVYHYVGLHFKDNENVNLHTSASDIIHFGVNGLKFRLEHGDNIKFTGQAISGPLNSWERARLKRVGTDSATGNHFDILIFGHFHQHLISNKIIAMDSTKGYDTYVMSMALPYALPGATTFAVNSRGEVIFGTNLKCRIKTKTKRPDKSIELF